MSIYEPLFDAIVEGDEEKAGELTRGLVKGGANPKGVIEEVIVRSMELIGERFRKGEMFVPEMLASANAAKKCMGILEPLLAKSDKKDKIKFVIGTVEGDLHDIGKNLVAMMLEGSGFEVIDLGVGVTSKDFVEKVKEVKAPFLGMSALLTTTMPRMLETIKALQQAGLRDRVKVMVGGAPVTEKFARQIGADAYAPDASSAVEIAKGLSG